jgi:hypothetical protein
MRRMRTMTAALTTIALGGALALVGASGAQAAPENGHWGTFTVTGTNSDYSGSMSLPGFPATTFTSNSRQPQVISGASTWQSLGTGPGAVYGTSRGSTYMNQRPLADRAGAPSVTTYTFADATPASGWSFVLGDIDADQATITATDANGAAVPSTALGFQGQDDRGYNSCSTVAAGGWSCPTTPADPTPGSDTPTWNPGTSTLTGNAAAADTSGASAWFSPTTPLSSLTISFERRAGFPVYQTWFADTTAAITGTATLDGVAIPGATVTATAPRGTVYTTTTDAQGRYSFPDLVQLAADYTVAVTPPPGAAGTASGPVSITAGDGTRDFPFTSPPGTTSIIGTVVDDQGDPVADVPVSVTPPGAGPVDTTTNADGVYVVSDLPPETEVAVSVAGGTPVPVTTGAEGVPTTPAPIEAPAAAIAVVSGAVTLNGTGIPTTAVELLDGTGAVISSTDTAADGSYAFPAVPRGAYQVRVVDQPAGSTEPTTQPADATAGDVAVPFAFTADPVVAPADRTIAGTVRLDGAALPNATVELLGSDGSVVATVTTGSDGTYSFADQSEATYTVRVTPPAGATGATEAAANATTGNASDIDFAFTTAVVTVTQPGTVADANGTPVAGQTVTATPVDPADGDAVTTTTAADGSFTLQGLAPSTAYRITTNGAAAQTVTTPATGGGTPIAFVVTAVTVTPTPAPQTPVVVQRPGGQLAYTGSNPAPVVVGGGLLILMGIAFLVSRAIRSRRHRDQLHD